MIQFGGDVKTYVFSSLSYLLDRFLSLAFNRLPCGHAFHQQCVARTATNCTLFLKTRPLCPTCLKEFSLADDVENIHLINISTIVAGAEAYLQQLGLTNEAMATD